LLDLPLASLTREHFEKHMVERSKTPLARTKKKGKTKAKVLPSAATLNRCNATMRPVLEMARKRGLIATNPLADVAKSKEDKNRAIRAMTKQEEKSIEAVFTKRREEREAEVAEINERRAAEGKKPIPAVPRFLDYLESMFVVSVETGIRRGEAFSLTWADVALDDFKITIRGEEAKSSQSRMIPLTPRAHGILTEWQAQGDGKGLVWPSRIGGTRLKNIDGAWRQLCKDAGITGLRWHDAGRHTFGSRAALAGMPMVVLKDAMGHSAISTTMRYSHTTEADVRAGFALLSK
jgi:integrase